MKMATVAEHTNIFAAPHTSKVSNLRPAEAARQGYLKQPALLGGVREREDGEEAKRILYSVKWRGSAHQARCSIAVLEAI